VISRLTDDVEEIEDLLLSGLASAISYVFQLIIFTVALFYLDWRLAFVSLFMVPFFWLPARHFSSRIKGAAREGRRRSGSIVAAAEESLSNVALIQAYSRESEEVPRFHRENKGSMTTVAKDWTNGTMIATIRATSERTATTSRTRAMTTWTTTMTTSNVARRSPVRQSPAASSILLR